MIINNNMNDQKDKKEDYDDNQDYHVDEDGGPRSLPAPV